MLFNLSNGRLQSLVPRPEPLRPTLPDKRNAFHLATVHRVLVARQHHQNRPTDRTRSGVHPFLRCDLSPKSQNPKWANAVSTFSPPSRPHQLGDLRDVTRPSPLQPQKAGTPSGPRIRSQKCPGERLRLSRRAATGAIRCGVGAGGHLGREVTSSPGAILTSYCGKGFLFQYFTVTFRGALRSGAETVR